MAKRLMMILLFVGALGMAGLINPSTAEARHGCHRGYGGYGGGVGSYYYGGPALQRSYYGGSFYTPYQSYYYGGPRVYGGPGYYGGGGLYLNSPGAGLYIRF